MTDIHPATPMGSPAARTPGQAACIAYGESWANQGPVRRSLWESAALAAIDAAIAAGPQLAHVGAALEAHALRERARLAEEVGDAAIEDARQLAAELAEVRADLSHTMAAHAADSRHLHKLGLIRDIVTKGSADDTTARRMVIAVLETEG